MPESHIPVTIERVVSVELTFYAPRSSIFDAGKNERSDGRSARQKTLELSIDRTVHRRERSVWRFFRFAESIRTLRPVSRRSVKSFEERERSARKREKRDYVAPINVTRDRCKSLQTARDRAMSLTLHLVMLSGKPNRFVLLIYRAYYFGDIR